jgi:hypothetical protein
MRLDPTFAPEGGACARAFLLRHGRSDEADRFAGAAVDVPEIRLASRPGSDDELSPHGLGAAERADIAGVLGRQPRLLAAYLALVRVADGGGQQQFLLGIVPDRRLGSDDTAQLVARISEGIRLPAPVELVILMGTRRKLLSGLRALPDACILDRAERRSA